MRYFFDTEFDEDGHTIELLSIGIVAEDGRELYCANSEADLTRPNDWVKANVIPHLPPLGDPRWMTKREIRDAVLAFCDPEVHGGPEFWAYFGAYDWVVFCQLFGRMIDLPKGYPMWVRELKQLAGMLGVLRDSYPAQSGTLHDALEDARWNLALYQYLLGAR